MKQLCETIQAYVPCNAQEEQDQKLMMEYIQAFPNLLTRENTLAHFTASSWIVNPQRTKVLMAYHNIYRSWAWTGGHADGEADLLAVALREAREETGIVQVLPLLHTPLSLEIICVEGHVKRGSYVSSHLHLNITYLLEANDGQALMVKPDENSRVGWVPIQQAADFSTEPWMQGIYRKLNQSLENRLILHNAGI